MNDSWRFMKQYDWEAPAGWTGSHPKNGEMDVAETGEDQAMSFSTDL